MSDVPLEEQGVVIVPEDSAPNAQPGHEAGSTYDRSKVGRMMFRAALIDLELQGFSVAQMSVKTGRTRETVWHTRRSKEYVQELREARDAQRQAASYRLHYVPIIAVEQLRQIMMDKDQPAMARIAAANSVLDRTGFSATQRVELDQRPGPQDAVHPEMVGRTRDDKIHKLTTGYWPEELIEAGGEDMEAEDGTNGE